ncbi:hypothetical protein LINGRAHAP2_LOCUS12709, partial [Linum grandiflorum]
SHPSFPQRIKQSSSKLFTSSHSPSPHHFFSGVSTHDDDGGAGDGSFSSSISVALRLRPICFPCYLHINPRHFPATEFGFRPIRLLLQFRNWVVVSSVNIKNQPWEQVPAKDISSVDKMRAKQQPERQQSGRMARPSGDDWLRCSDHHRSIYRERPPPEFRASEPHANGCIGDNRTGWRAHRRVHLPVLVEKLISNSKCPVTTVMLLQCSFL